MEYLPQAMDNSPTVHNPEGSMYYQLDKSDDLLGRLCWLIFVLQVLEYCLPLPAISICKTYE
jgi:hypothetical protein